MLTLFDCVTELLFVVECELESEIEVELDVPSDIPVDSLPLCVTPELVPDEVPCESLAELLLLALPPIPNILALTPALFPCEETEPWEEPVVVF